MEEYALTGNASQAIVAAGYKGENPDVHGSLRMVKHGIRDAIALRREELAQLADIRARDVLGTLNTHMLASFANVLTEDGRFDYKHAVETGGIHLLRKIKITERSILGNDSDSGVIERKYELELHDAQAAAKQLCKVLGLETEKKSNPRDLAEKAILTVLQQAAQRGITLTRQQAIELLADKIPQLALTLE